MATEEEVRETLQPLVGQMVSVNRAGPVKLYTVEQADQDETYGGWAAGDWVMAVGDPDLDDIPLAWTWSTLAYLASHDVTVTAVST